MIRLFEYDSKQAQSLSQVPVHQPSIIRVIHGEKSLLWQDESVLVGQGQLLLIPAGSHISFVNRPFLGRYRAVQLLLPHDLPQGIFIEHGRLARSYASPKRIARGGLSLECVITEFELVAG